jgi:hypothetical protein
MLYDKNFLKHLDLEHNKTKFARITLLNINEEPITSLEGVVSQGTLNIDGSSSIRRTCSLTMVSNNINFSDYLWTLTSKIKLEIGLKNECDTRFPEFIWFP